jgi:hypothetical protein
MFLYSCPDILKDPFPPGVFECGKNKISSQCQKVYALYSSGSGGYEFPAEAGLELGTANNKNLILRVQYLNFGQIPLTDNSGFRVFYTSQLRQYNAAVMALGRKKYSTPPILVVPPYVQNHLEQNLCSTKCTNGFKQYGIKLIFSLFTGGALMRKAHAKILYQNGNVDETSIREDNFNFLNKNLQALDNPIFLNGSDEINSICEYDSSSRDTDSIQGENPYINENCNHFVGYYPKENGVDFCLASNNVPGTESCKKDLNVPGVILN